VATEALWEGLKYN